MINPENEKDFENCFNLKYHRFLSNKAKELQSLHGCSSISEESKININGFWNLYPQESMQVFSEPAL